MTKQQIENGCKRAVQDGADLHIGQSVEWLLDYGLIDWQTRTAIYAALCRARIGQPAPEEKSA